MWTNSLILVAEDDAQDGVDHVDGHRTVALAIGPHIRRDAVDSNHYNHTEHDPHHPGDLRHPAAHPRAEAARAMTSIFTDKPDLRRTTN